MKAAIVVPCYNERNRLDGQTFHSLANRVGRVIFVDDGSTDGTGDLLTELVSADPARLAVVTCDSNEGKGEAIRLGLIHALSESPEIVGYLDADLATPADECVRLVSILDDSDHLDAVIGSRVALAGRHISRRGLRHYVGRVYATAASAVLGKPVYDTQCGAKAFRVTSPLVEAVNTPFANRWSFDVELLGRLLRDRDYNIREEPLEEWAEVPGSKVGLRDGARAMWSLWVVRRRLFG